MGVQGLMGVAALHLALSISKTGMLAQGVWWRLTEAR